MATASVVLQTVWLNLASDPSQFQSFPLMSALKVTTTKVGSVRPYAGGRLRVITKAGISRDYALNLPWCTRDQIAWLEKYVGQLMCVRDDRGRKVWATYFVVPIDETAFDPSMGATTIALAEVTNTEAV